MRAPRPGGSSHKATRRRARVGVRRSHSRPRNESDEGTPQDSVIAHSGLGRSCATGGGTRPRLRWHLSHQQQVRDRLEVQRLVLADRDEQLQILRRTHELPALHLRESINRARHGRRMLASTPFPRLTGQSVGNLPSHPCVMRPHPSPITDRSALLTERKQGRTWPPACVQLCVHGRALMLET